MIKITQEQDDFLKHLMLDHESKWRDFKRLELPILARKEDEKVVFLKRILEQSEISDEIE